jgi:hypothetical protein
MNLIQVQEHLKDMPMRAIMEYANGKNPQVPPYLALGELNRRKQMEQSARTGTPPDGTVKDKLEKELTGQATDLMQAGAAKQAQSNEQLQQSLMGQPQPVPEGTPQPPQPEEPMPEMQQMAAGGLTSLPTGGMFKFAGGGGVVAFADEGLVVDQAEQAARDAKAALRQYGLRQQQQDPQGFAAAQQAAAAADAAVNDARRAAFGSDTGPAGALGQSMGAPVRNAQQQAAARVQPTFSPDDQSAAETARLARQNAGPPMGIATGTTPDASMMPPPMPGGGGGIPSLKIPKGPSFEAPDPDAYDKKLAAFKQANPGLAGSEFQKLLDKIAQQDEADRARFITQEKGRTRADFWKSLIDAGEATRGQKGIGALLGGFGKSAGASEAAAADRADAQAKMRRDQEMNMAKMRAELEAARRAEARGDFEGAFKHRQDAEKIGRDLQQTEFANQMEGAKLAEQARGHSIQAASANRDPELIKIARSIHKPGMPWEEALDRAAHYARGAQYETVAQREKAALGKDLSAKTNMIDMQLAMTKPGSSDHKELMNQRQRIIDQFLADQKMLGGKLGGNAPAATVPGKVERLG